MRVSRAALVKWRKIKSWADGGGQFFLDSLVRKAMVRSEMERQTDAGMRRRNFLTLPPPVVACILECIGDEDLSAGTYPDTMTKNLSLDLVSLCVRLRQYRPESWYKELREYGLQGISLPLPEAGLENMVSWMKRCTDDGRRMPCSAKVFNQLVNS